jgi:hypothetical protein
MEQLAKVLPADAFEPSRNDADEEKGLFEKVKDIFG